MHTNNIKRKCNRTSPTSNLVSISNNNKGTRDQLTGNASHSQHCKDVIKFPVQINPKDNFYNETLITTNSNASKIQILCLHNNMAQSHHYQMQV